MKVLENNFCYIIKIFCRSVGYDISSSGVIESEQLYLKRMCGIARLYFAVMVVNCKDRPFPIDTAWNWIADTLNIGSRNIIFLLFHII